MSIEPKTVSPASPMSVVLAAFPGAQRALFRRYHIGGCSHCGFQPAETLEQVCERNNGLDPSVVMEYIRSSHEEDAKILMEPQALKESLQAGTALTLLDVRSRPEYEAVHIEGAVLMSQTVSQELLAQGPDNRLLVIVDHQGKQGLDAAAYFIGHGLRNVRCLRGGIDAWSQEVDPGVRRYQLA